VCMAHLDTTLKPPARPHVGGILDPGSPSYRWWIAATVMLSSFLVPMSQSAMQVALPQMMTVFGLDLDQAQWIVTAYIIAGAMVVPAIGWLGNRLGNRTFYVLALGLFVTNSALCTFAWSGSSLIAFRILQGLGGGPIPPMTMMFLSTVFPPEQRGLAMGLFGMGQTSGPILGTVIGGYLTEYLSWRMVCFMNVTPGVLCIALVLLVLPNVRDEVQRALDPAGLFTMGVFLISLLVALSRGQREGWDAPLIQRLFVVAAVAFASFIACELLVKEPLVDLRIYTNMTFAAVSGIILLFFMAFAASTFALVILLQRLMEYTPAQAGLALLPGSLVLALSFPLAGRVADRFDRRLIMLCALGIFALSSYLSAFLNLEWPLRWFVWLVVLRFSCGGFVYAPVMAVALSQLPPEKVRMGSGMLNLMQNGLGNTLGLAMATTVLQRRLTYHSDLLNQQQVASALSWGELLVPVREVVRRAGAIGPLEDAQVLALVRGHLDQQASVAAYQDCFMLVMFLCLASMPLVLLLRKSQA
jgi:MFS transporter, DHA2 family, multidrug resistance protein